MWFGKVQLFWEGHKSLHYPPYSFDIYLEKAKTIRRIVQIFVASSEKLIFKNVALNDLQRHQKSISCSTVDGSGRLSIKSIS